MKIIEKFTKLLYPESIYCVLCGSVINNSRHYSLCDSCIEKFMWVSEKDILCSKCGKVIDLSDENNLCEDCNDIEHFFHNGYTCARYSLYERNLILEFKKRDETHIGRLLGQILYDRFVITNECIDGIISVPIHKNKLKSRGYNQAYIMAKYFAKLSNKPLYKNIIKRKEDTAPMKKLGVHERRENLKTAFVFDENYKDIIKNKNLLIIDDIYTTGATMDACSKLLKENGAKKVIILTFAAGSK